MALVENIILRGNRAGQPAASSANEGFLYCVTDEDNIVERSNGTTWDAYSPEALSSAWVLADSWTHSGDVSEVIFTDLGGYSEILVLCTAITKSVSTVISMTVSIDNGSTFLTSSGDYIQIAESGAPTNAALVNLHFTNATTARYGMIQVRAWNLTTPKIYSIVNRSDTSGTNGIIPTANDLDALRIFPSGGGNFTAGSIYVYGRP